MNTSFAGYKAILAATDFSDHGLAAVRRAAWVARQSCKKLVVANVVADIRKAIHHTSYHSRLDFLEGKEEHFQHELRRESDEKLKRQILSLGSIDIDVKYETLLGEPFEELIHSVQQEGYDLVVAGTRGHNALQRLVMGSTAKRLVRNCPSSVWIVKDKDIRPPKKILAAVDLSKVSQRVLDQAIWTAQRAGSELHVLHVIESTGLSTELLDVKVSRSQPVPLRELIQGEVQKQFETFLSSSDLESVATTKHLLWGSPAYEAARLASDLKTDLVVIGTIGRKGLEGLRLGNTAESVLAHCDCDVLTVKPAEYVSPIKPAAWPLHPGPEKAP
jgi:universal stress protein E